MLTPIPEPDATANIQTAFLESIQKYAVNPLIVDEKSGRVFSYKEVREQTMSLLSFLQSAGLSTGDRICIKAHTCWQSIVLCWASFLGGYIIVPLDPELTSSRMDDVVGLCTPALLCYAEKAATVKSDESILRFKDLRSINVNEWDFNTILDLPYAPPELPVISSGTPAVILFTSGTTGKAKGVLHGHSAFYLNALRGVEFFGWCESDIVLSQGDLFTMSGIQCVCATSIISGSSILLLSPETRKSVFSIASAVYKHGCTIIKSTPEFYKQCVAFKSRIHPDTFESIRILISGGSELPPGLTEDFESCYRRRILNIYGQTESCGLVIAQPPGSTEYTNGLMGIPVGCEIICRDSTGNILPDGVEGELYIRSPTMMLGYYGDEDKTFLDREGWYRTGDICKTENGQVFITGRIADFIKTAKGERIHPREIECVIENHESILEAGVCGVTVEGKLEKIAAFIVEKSVSPDFNTLKADLQKMLISELGKSRVPAFFLRCEKLPRGAYGKLQRRVLMDNFRIESVTNARIIRWGDTASSKIAYDS